MRIPPCQLGLPLRQPFEDERERAVGEGDQLGLGRDGQLLGLVDELVGVGAWAAPGGAVGQLLGAVLALLDDLASQGAQGRLGALDFVEQSVMAEG